MCHCGWTEGKAPGFQKMMPHWFHHRNVDGITHNLKSDHVVKVKIILKFDFKLNRRFYLISCRCKSSFQFWVMSPVSWKPSTDWFRIPRILRIHTANSFGNRGGKIFHSIQIHSSKKQLHFCHSVVVEPGSSPSHVYQSQLWEPNRGMTRLPGCVGTSVMKCCHTGNKWSKGRMNFPDLCLIAQSVCAHNRCHRVDIFFFCSPTAPFPLCGWAVPDRRWGATSYM